MQVAMSGKGFASGGLHQSRFVLARQEQLSQSAMSTGESVCVGRTLSLAELAGHFNQHAIANAVHFPWRLVFQQSPMLEPTGDRTISQSTKLETDQYYISKSKATLGCSYLWQQTHV